MKKEQQGFSLPKHPFLTQSQDPLHVLEELFSSYELKDIRIIQWEMLKAALASDYFSLQKERNDAVFFYETILTALEAIYMLHNKGEKETVVKKKKSSPKKALSKKSK